MPYDIRDDVLRHPRVLQDRHDCLADRMKDELRAVTQLGFEPTEALAGPVRPITVLVDGQRDRRSSE